VLYKSLRPVRSRRGSTATPRRRRWCGRAGSSPLGNRTSRRRSTS